jgi:hypothetical protein
VARFLKFASRMIQGSRLVVLLGAAVLAAGFAACTVGGGGTDPGDDTEPQCNGPLGAPIPDPTVLDACCTGDVLGHAHCLDAARVPAELAGYVDVCPSGGYCIEF